MELLREQLKEFWEDEKILPIVKVALAVLITNKLLELGDQIIKEYYENEKRN